jgi:FAD/FMN-containing dehydrogenase
MRVPAEDVVYSVTLLRNVPPADVETALKTNRALYERARALGGKRLVWGSIPFSSADWAEHFGPELWSRFKAAKQRLDPRGVLTPGPGMFE